MKKRMRLLIVLAMLVLMAIPGAAVFAEDGTDPADGNSDPVWAEGKIKIDCGLVSADKYRNDMQSPRGMSISWLSLPYYSSFSVDLLNSKREVVGSSKAAARPEFTGLPAGDYIIHITLDPEKFSIVRSIVNGGPIDFLLTDWETPVHIDETKREVTKWVVVEPKAFGFKTVTDIGTFEKGTDRDEEGNVIGKERDYYPSTGPDGLRNWHFDNTDPSRMATNPTFSTHSGIYYGDSADLYSGMNTLEIPVLSDEEKAKGYTFRGWRLLEGGRAADKGKVLSESEALSYVISADTVLKAEWDAPKHTITFRTNGDYGTIGGGTEYSYDVDFNNQTVPEIPEVTPSDGRTFVGWFTDLSMNVVSEETIQNTIVDRDLTYYAKYQGQQFRTVSFRTSSKFGTLKDAGGADTYDLRLSTDNTKLAVQDLFEALPEPVPQKGYEFEGWYQDMTKNILESDSILKTGVNENPVFYAKYKRIKEEEEKPGDEPAEPTDPTDPTLVVNEEPTNPTTPTDPTDPTMVIEEEPTDKDDPTMVVEEEPTDEDDPAETTMVINEESRGSSGSGNTKNAHYSNNTTRTTTVSDRTAATGDNSKVVLMGILFIISLIGISVVVLDRRRRRS